MQRLVFILSISIGSVLAGYFLRRAAGKSVRAIREHAGDISRIIKLTSIFVLNPIAVVNSFWQMEPSSGRIVLLPLLGLLSLAIGGGAAIIANRVFGIPPKRAASVFVASMFTNIVTYGGLVSFVFFGADGYGYVQLYNMFVSLAYYAVGYPISEQLAMENRSGFSISPRIILDRPYLLAPISAIAIGIALNLLGVPRPAVVAQVVSVLIPVITFLLGFSIGLTLFFGRIRAYAREIAIISAIKFVVVPALMIPVGLLLGFHEIANGAPFKVLAILSVMPVAFNALVPPVVYGFDLDLANSAWIVTTLALTVIVPLIYVVLIV